jgi:hypothetical protein
MAATCCVFAGLILGSLTGDLMSLAAGRSVTMNVSILPWWFDAAMAAVALVIAAQLTQWRLCVPAVAFAADRFASIASVAQALSIGVAAFFALHALFASTLMLAAWPKAGWLARSSSLLLLVLGAAVRFWLGRPTSVVGT